MAYDVMPSVGVGGQMRPLIARIALIVVFLSSGNAEAKQYGVWGVGLRSCVSWSSDRSQQSWGALVDLAWVQGFVTAMDYDSVKVNNASHKIDDTAMAAWFDNYCSGHPLDNISQATEALTVELESRK